MADRSPLTVVLSPGGGEGGVREDGQRMMTMCGVKLLLSLMADS
jgi:hypothetical protein